MLSSEAQERSSVQKAIISDHLFPSIELQRRVFESAGFDLQEMKPICVTEDDVIQKCAGADVLLVQFAPITKRVLAALPRIKGVVRYGIGVDNIDLEAAKELQVPIANVPGFCIDEVSNHAMAMILSLAKRIAQDHYRIAHGKWGVNELLPIPALSDLTLGLIGFGGIARQVAKKARVFGFSIIAFDPFLAEAAFAEFGVKKADLESVLRSSDIISVHCPLSPETTHLINRESIAKMKPGVILVNTSRGAVVQESDLIQALESGRVLGAGLDVFEQEPLALDSPLRTLSNVILTSHAAAVSTRSVERLQIKAAKSACDFLLNKRPAGALVWPYAV